MFWLWPKRAYSEELPDALIWKDTSFAKTWSEPTHELRPMNWHETQHEVAYEPRCEDHETNLETNHHADNELEDTWQEDIKEGFTGLAMKLSCSEIHTEGRRTYHEAILSADDIWSLS